MVAPSLAAFIAALHIRHHQSRRKIREFLLTWMGVPLSVGSIDRCIREVGVACEPIVEDLLEEVRASGIIHADETPWYQGILNCWLWVVLTATTAVFHIGSRRHEEIRDLLGDAIVGWLVTDGYGAYRDDQRRQRCLAHLIRKGLALAGSLSPGGHRPPTQLRYPHQRGQRRIRRFPVRGRDLPSSSCRSLELYRRNTRPRPPRLQAQPNSRGRLSKVGE